MDTAKSKAYVGVTGFGKSWAMGSDIEEWFKKDFFPVIIDKKGDHNALGSSLGFKEFKVGKKGIDKMSPDKWKNLITNSKKQGATGIVIKPKEANPNISPDDLMQLANDVAYAVLSIDFPIYYGIEEIRNFTPSQTNKKNFNAVTTCIVEGRSKDVVFGCTLQFPQQVHFVVIQAFPIFYVFGLGENDNKYDKFGIDGRLRSNMKNWAKDERKCLKIDNNEGDKQVISTKNWSRSTPHSG